MVQPITMRPGPPPTPSTPTGGEHVVRRGDTLWSIARQHGVPLDALRAANPDVADQRFIFPGDRLTIPGPSRETTSHLVRRGDTVAGIARAHGSTVQAIATANGLRDPDLIFPGTRLAIPGSTPPRTHAAAAPPSDHPRQAAPAAPATTARTAAVPATGGASIRAMFDPALGSAAPGAIIIGQAEGTRTPSGGFRAGYGGHVDPGNGAGNRGSFSLQNARSLTPEQADAQQLRALGARIPIFEAAARRAGVDAGNVQLATAYLDLHNQSPAAAVRFLDQIGYLREAGIGSASLAELRFRSFVDVGTGDRFRLSGGGQAGGGFVTIAGRALGRPPLEREVQAVIRTDQLRRINAMAAVIPQQAAATRTGPAAPTTVAPSTGRAEAARFGSNPGIDLSAEVVRRTNVLFDAVRAETGHSIYVTSGRRGPERQAAAMYDRFVGGTLANYRDARAFAEVQTAYRTGTAAGEGRTAVVARMTAVLEAQVERGVLISRHMSSRAVDIRFPPHGERDAVVAAIRGNPAVQSVGIENDHLHVQYR